MRNALASLVRNTVFANLLLLLIFAAGFSGTVMMIREVLPSFAVESIQVRVPYPGAGPEEVEEGIALKIEDAIEGVQGIKKYVTTSAEGIGTAVIDVKTGEDVQVVKDRISDRINAITTFPDDAERPSVSELIIERGTLAVSLAGNIPRKQLKELAEDVKDDLVQLPNVSSVNMIGVQDYEISIEISEKALRRYGLTFDEVSRIVRNTSLNLPGGQLRSDAEEIKIRTMGRNYTGKEFGEIVLLAREDGTLLRLRDIASIRDDFVEDKVLTRFEGKPAATLMVNNSEDEDALKIAGEVQNYVTEKNAEFERLGVNATLDIKTWLNASRFITERISMLLKNGAIGLSLVFLLLWVFLDFRLAVWVSLGIPISLSGALFLMYLVGETINMISLFAMIMVLGIIVDDAIVVGEAIYVHRKRGKGAIRAAVDGTMEVGMPIVAAVLTSCIAFLPLFFIEGIMGKFVKVIPTVVVCALLISLVEALIILPAHLNHLPDMNRPHKTRNPVKRLLERIRKRFNHGLEVFIEHYYRGFLRSALSWRYVSLAAAFAVLLITMGFVQGGMIKFVFFPQIDTSFVFAKVEFPEGTPTNVTHDAIIRLEDALGEVAEETPTLTGEPLIVASQSSVGMQLTEMPPTSGSHRGELIVELLDSEKRGVHYREIIRRWREKAGPIPGVVSLAFEADSGGPPGAPIEIWLLGDDMAELRDAADGLKGQLGQYAGVFQIEDDFRPGKRELHARLKPEARALGLTTGDLARQLRQGFYGDEAMRIQRGRDELKVWIRYPQEERRTLANVDSIRIRTPLGEEVPLESVAETTIEDGYTTITRKDGQRRISVTADVFTEITNANEVLEKVERDFIPIMEQDHPGVTASLEGEKREMQDSTRSLLVGFPLAILGIYLLIATLFRSYIQPMVILFTVPFGLIGAIWGHMALGYDLTMMSLFGMVALAGVVVNDAIVMIEAVNDRLANGMGFTDSVVDGGSRRFRAILLTTATTVGGLTPLIMERSLQAQFLIPMALTIAAGVGFATVLTLVVIPCLLYILNDVRLLWKDMKTGRKHSREEVEPATLRNLSDDELFQDEKAGSPGDLGPEPA